MSWQISHFDQLDSTNDALKRFVLQDPKEDKYVFTAQTQTKGKGRRGRDWVSPLGNLYMSLAFKVSDLSYLGNYSFLTSLALAQAIEDVCPKCTVLCKWPNDLLINASKVSGILLETEGKKSIEWLIIGLGVNIFSCPLNATTLYKTTCLKDQGYDLDPPVLLEAFLTRFDFWKNTLLSQGFSSILKAWKQKAFGLGSDITVRLPDRIICGIFLDLDQDGTLLLKNDLGIHKITAGDVFFPAL